MTRIAALCCVALLLGCTQTEEGTEGEGDAPEMPTISLADVAGTWDMEALNEAGDSVVIAFGMTATEEMDGWTIEFPDTEPIAGRVVAVDGDSITVEVGPFPSQLRDNVMVSTQTVFRLDGETLRGTFVAHYENAGADSILRGRQRGTRRPG